MAARYAEKLHIVPLLAPVSSTDAVAISNAVNLENAHWVSFLVNWGAITGDTEKLVVSVEASTHGAATTNSADTAIPFVYRLSSTLAADNWGDPTTCASTGLEILGTNDSMALLIDVDPATIPALDSDATYLHVILDGTGLSTNAGMSVYALMEDRYPQAEHVTST